MDFGKKTTGEGPTAANTTDEPEKSPPSPFEDRLTDGSTLPSGQPTSNINEATSKLAMPIPTLIRKGLGAKRKTTSHSPSLPETEGTSSSSKRKKPASERSNPCSLPADPNLITKVMAKATQPPPPDYKILIRPLMGQPFQIILPPDSSIFDLKVAIFNQTGVFIERQLLGYTHLAIDFSNEEAFLDEVNLPSQCTLSMTIKALSGKNSIPLLVDSDYESFYIDELFIPRDGQELVVSSGSSSSTECDSEEADEIKNSPKNENNWATTSKPLSPTFLSSLGLIEETLDIIQSLKIEVSIEDEVTTPTATSFTEEKTSTTSSNATSQNTNVFNGPIRCAHCSIRCRPAQQFKCKCSNYYCPSHRFSDQHHCSFDFKGHERAKLAQLNPKVQNPLIEDI